MKEHWIEKRLAELKRAGRNKSQRGLAEAIGASRDATISEIKSGKREISAAEVLPMAQYLELPPTEILTHTIKSRGQSKLREVPKTDLFPVSLRGVVQAGVFSVANHWDESDWGTVFASAPIPRHPAIYALRVGGASMNRVFPDGTVLFVVPSWEMPTAIRSGAYVIVERRVSGEGDSEITVKQLEFEGKKAWLWPRSTDPKFQQPIEYQMPTAFGYLEDGGAWVGVRVIAVVIGSQRSELVGF